MYWLTVMNRLLVALVAALLPLSIACNVSVESGASDGGSGGSGGGGDGAEDECTDPKPECLYDVPSHCKDYGNGPVWECEPTPLVLAFDREPITYSEASTAGFDLVGRGARLASDWPTASTPWLALDRDHDGAIHDATELFGSAVTLSTGARAKHGFEALAELDENRDGQIDARDARFADLAMWLDADANRSTDAGELVGLDAGGRRIVSIDLGYHVSQDCDARGNCAIERATFAWIDGLGGAHVGEIVDVHLPLR